MYLHILYRCMHWNICGFCFVELLFSCIFFHRYFFVSCPIYIYFRFVFEARCTLGTYEYHMYHLMGCLLCFINRKPSCFNCCVRFLGQDHDFCNVLNKKKTKEKRCLLLDVVSRLGLSPLKVIFTTSKMMPTLELESVFCPRCTGVRLEKVYSTAISSSVSPKKPK